MKYLKILGLAAVAAMALMAFGAGTASATKLYSTGVAQPAGTEIVATLKTGTSANLTTTAGATIQTCTGSEVVGSIGNAGGAAATVSGKVSKLTFTGCPHTVDVEELGELEIHHIAGTTNGTLTAKGFKVRVDTTLFGGLVTCRYSAGAGTHMGTLTGANPGNATMAVNAIVSRVEVSSALCPSDARWVATYIVTKPHALTVEAS